jgi:hypothetical protein
MPGDGSPPRSSSSRSSIEAPPGHDPLTLKYDRNVTHYEVLGVDRTASPAAIRSAYLARARAAHPDLQTDARRRADAEVEMRRLNEAWSVLGHEDRRLAYDAALHDRAWRDRPANSPSPGFVPIVDDDTDYAALLDDTPVDGTRVPRWLQLLPVVALGLAILSLCAGLVATFPPLIALGGISLVVSILGFLAAPVFAVMASYQQERE